MRLMLAGVSIALVMSWSAFGQTTNTYGTFSAALGTQTSPLPFSWTPPAR
jgi:hypothetical protein